MTNPASETIAFRLSLTERKRVIAAAAEENSTMSRLIRKLVVDAISKESGRTNDPSY